jgi:quercetin dioxygenase-like cupin family protein
VEPEIMFQYKVDFDKLAWESPIKGVRHKYIDQDKLRLRLVEYTQAMPAHWCQQGHYGYLLEGELEIEYEKTTEVYHPGDGIFIPDGPEHKHRGKVLSKKAMVFFVEKK